MLKLEKLRTGLVKIYALKLKLKDAHFFIVSNACFQFQIYTTENSLGTCLTMYVFWELIKISEDEKY